MASYYFGKGLPAPVIKEDISPIPTTPTPSDVISKPGTTPTTPTTQASEGKVIYVPATQQCPAGYTDGGILPAGNTEEIERCKNQVRATYRECLRLSRERRDAGAEVACERRLQEELDRCDSLPGRMDKRKCIPIGRREEPRRREDGDGAGCAGGYKLGTDFAGGKGRGIRPIGEEYGIPSDAGWGRSGDWEGHIIWHDDWGFHYVTDVADYYKTGAGLTVNTGGACRNGYKTEIINGEKWCCPTTAGVGATTEGMGAFGWPSGMEGLYGGLLGRAQELLGRTPGWTQEALDAMFGRGFEKVRGLAAPTREAEMVTMARQGLLGTGTEAERMSDIAWGTERGVSDLMRDLFVEKERKEMSDLLGLTGAAGGLFQPLMQYSQIQEAINAGRRGERSQALMMLLSLMSQYMSSWAQ